MSTEYINVIVAALAALFSAAYVIFFARVFTIYKPRRLRRLEEAKKDFFAQLNNRLDKGLMRNDKEEDFAQVKRNVERNKSSALFEISTLDMLLEDYLAYLVVDANAAQAPDHYRFVQAFLDRLRAQKPFSSLPPNERLIAQALQQGIERGEKEEARSRLSELTEATAARIDQANRDARRNAQLALVGALASVAGFTVGIIGLFRL